MPRRAIVLMNLGAPDRPEAVRPFLFNLFADPAIITLPGVLRLPGGGGGFTDKSTVGLPQAAEPAGKAGDLRGWRDHPRPLSC